MTIHPSQYLSIGEASSVLGVSIVTLRRWDRQGRITTYRTAGGHRRFLREDVLREIGRGVTTGGVPQAEIAIEARKAIKAQGPLGAGELARLLDAPVVLVDAALVVGRGLREIDEDGERRWTVRGVK